MNSTRNYSALLAESESRTESDIDAFGRNSVALAVRVVDPKIPSLVKQAFVQVPPKQNAPGAQKLYSISGVHAEPYAMGQNAGLVRQTSLLSPINSFGEQKSASDGHATPPW